MPTPLRVVEVHRDRVTVRVADGLRSLFVPYGLLAPDGLPVTVGDWVVASTEGERVDEVRERRTLIRRRAVGGSAALQPIAANVDTLFVVTSCNDDFNPSRLERYLALARESRVRVVIVLTKRDLSAEPETFEQRARELGQALDVVALDATSAASVAQLSPWLAAGQSVAFAGSSGVGKSTLVNTLLRGDVQRTAGIREDDSRGRHTTTSRRLFTLPQGACVIDTPGMRELETAVTEAEVLDDVFADLALLARRCRFRDCAHRGDTGCAIGAAVASGTLDPRRLANYLKLQREADRAARTAVEQRASDRRFGRMARTVMRDKRRRREE